MPNLGKKLLQFIDKFYITFGTLPCMAVSRKLCKIIFVKKCYCTEIQYTTNPKEQLRLYKKGSHFFDFQLIFRANN